MKVFVGNLDFDSSRESIQCLFKRFGTVYTVEIATDWETGQSRGFAFVLMPDSSEAEAAISHLDGAALDGRELTVREAPPVIPTGFESLAC